MKTGFQMKWEKLLLPLSFACMLIVHTGCELVPGDNGTDNTTTTTTIKLWAGDEEITVTYGSDEALVHLSDLPVSVYEGTEGVRLSDVITKANLIDPGDKYFNFIAADGYDMSKMAVYWGKRLPVWEDMQRGYFYDGGSEIGLTIRWEEGTDMYAFDGGRFYNVTYMDGGIAQILDEDVQ